MYDYDNDERQRETVTGGGRCRIVLGTESPAIAEELKYDSEKSCLENCPWCKEGDFVITRAYSGTRIKIFGNEFRIINDDTVEAVVDDPRGYERA